MSVAATVLAGALLAGFVNGLAGFGTGLVALGLWLHVLAPTLAAPLVVICSVFAQIQSLVWVRSTLNFGRLLPFLAGGVLGVPVGVMALQRIETETFRLAVGIFLVAYCGFMLLARRLPVIDWGGRPADAAVGLAGGILGGAAGLSGALVTVWCNMKGWRKGEQRAVYQPFNLTILSWALVSYAMGDQLTAEIGRLTLICLPGTVLGVWLGVKTYGHVDDRQFRQIVLWLLLASGGVLLATNLF